MFASLFAQSDLITCNIFSGIGVGLPISSIMFHDVGWSTQ